MGFKVTLAAAALGATLAGNALAQSSGYFTVTTSGVISSGDDYFGLFGRQGANLAGDTFTMTQTIDASMQALSLPIYSEILIGSFATHVESVTMTVNGHTFTTNAGVAPPNNFQFGSDLQLANPVETHNTSGEQDQFRATTSGVYENIGEIYADTGVGGPYALVPTINPYASFVDQFAAPVAGAVTFEVLFPHSNETLTGTSSMMALNAVSAVPEPSTYALWLVGLAVLGLAVRRGRPITNLQALCP